MIEDADLCLSFSLPVCRSLSVCRCRTDKRMARRAFLIGSRSSSSVTGVISLLKCRRAYVDRRPSQIHDYLPRRRFVMTATARLRPRSRLLASPSGVFSISDVAGSNGSLCTRIKSGSEERIDNLYFTDVR